ncbi:hypothetical protein CEXT_451951 [Caerostris extrusa]|uniref:Uncharacterized protein n=1 Tax=Caerostris extrusa TaxID=172846 RepID=A0AAV4P8G1_CAEEX|nr:hypothetical protein CEXT_451951 [Caerostris extrusa]
MNAINPATGNHGASLRVRQMFSSEGLLKSRGDLQQNQVVSLQLRPLGLTRNESSSKAIVSSILCFKTKQLHK